MTDRKRRGRGEGGVRYDERRGLWVASLSLGYHADGRRNRPVAYGKTKREALDALDALRKGNAARLPDEAAKLTVGDLLGLWLAAGEGRVAASTDEARRKAAATVAGAIGGTRAAALTTLGVARLYALLRSGAPSAALHAARALRACLRHAVTLGVLASDVAAGVPLPAMPEREMVVLSPAQAKALLAASAGYVAGPLIAVALGTGLRQGEQLGLTADDVDLAAATLTVRRQLTRTKAEGFALSRPKTKAARRTIALPAFAVLALREAMDGLPAGRTIFAAAGGAHRYRGQLTKHLKTAIRRANRAGAGIPETFRWHDQRHTHASLLLSAGHSVKAVSARLGHASAAFTLARYAHLMPGDDLRLAEGVQAILG